MGNEHEGKVIRERPGCVIGVALGIMLVVSAVAFLLLPKTEARDGAKLLETWLGVQQLPQGFEIRDAAKFMGGEEVVKLANTAAAAEQPRTHAPTPAKGADGETQVDWSKVIAGAADQLPRALIFVHFPKAQNAGELERLFSDKLVVGKLADIGDRGGQVILEIGTLPFGDSNPAYVLERNFEPGGTFKDVARVNMSNISEGLMVDAEWSRSEAFSKSRLQLLLEMFHRR